MESKYLSIGSAALMIGVCTKTLRRWDKKGQFKSSFRTIGNHRRYDRGRILGFLGKVKNITSARDRKRCVVYGRVSASRQKKSGDLRRQIDSLISYSDEKGYKVVKVFSDVGSGLNDKRKSLLGLLKDASLGKFDVVVVNYNDRLARFWLQIIREYLRSWDVELVVVHPTVVEESPHAELVTDLTSILYSFMGKLYRLRRKN